jgi:hypothetical protein
MTRHRKEETLSEYSAKLARGIEFLEKYRQLCPEDQKLIMSLVEKGKDLTKEDAEATVRASDMRRK